jgi:hypothetical protein
LLGDQMAALPALVIVMMIVGMGAVVVVVVMTMPVIMPVPVAFMLGIVARFIPSPRHKHFKVLGAVRVVVVFAESPVIEEWISGK